MVRGSNRFGRVVRPQRHCTDIATTARDRTDACEPGGVDAETPSEFTSRQARAVIVGAEAVGFEREPDLFARAYDHSLHEDAHYAASYLRARGGEALEVALSAPDPVPTWVAVDRVMNEGMFSLAEVRVCIEAAADRGYVAPEPEVPCGGYMDEFGRGRAALTFLWDTIPDEIPELLGDAVLIAPLPPGAVSHCVVHKYAGTLPEEPDGRELSFDW